MVVMVAGITLRKQVEVCGVWTVECGEQMSVCSSTQPVRVNRQIYTELIRVAETVKDCQSRYQDYEISGYQIMRY